MKQENRPSGAVGARTGRSLRKMNREGLILLIRDLMAENEQLRADLSAALADQPEPIPFQDVQEPALLMELRGLKGSIDALKDSFDGFHARHDAAGKALWTDPGEGAS